jgi:hypothetical protein
VPALCAGRAHALARRCRGTRDQTARGDDILHRRHAVQVVQVVVQHEAEELADPGDGLQPIQRGRVMGLGRLDASEGDSAPPLVVLGAQGHVAGHTLWHSGSGQACSDAIAMGLVGDLLAELGPVIWTLGLLDMGQQGSALAHQGGAAASARAGGTHRRRRDRGLGEHAAAQQRGKLVRIARVVCGLATVESLQRAGLPQHTGEPLLSTPIREPVPGEATCDSHHETRTGRGAGLAKQVGGRLPRAVEQDRTIVCHDTDRQGAGRQVDPTVQGVLVGGASPEVFSSCVRDCFLSSAYHWGLVRRRPQSVSKAWSRLPTASAPLPLPAAAHAQR